MYDIIQKFEKLLNETGVAERSREFIRNSRRDGIRAEDLEEKEEKTNEEDQDEVVDEESDDEEVDTPDESPSTINLADASDYKKLKKNINKFRASHSLSDEEVNEELETYFNRLSDEEKKILHVFITGLTQVTLLDVSGKTAYIPADMKFKITKDGAASSEKIKSKARAQKLKDDKEVEDATNTPIKIGESLRQNKNDILKIVKENA